jgi:cytochrome c553
MSFWSLVGRQSLINPRCAGRLGRTIVVVTLTFCSASVPHAQPTAHPPDTIEARLLACAACHGRQGQGTNNDYFPRVAGKPAGYLLNQLLAFRDDRRRYPPMRLSARISSRDLPSADGGLLGGGHEGGDPL